MFGLVSTTEAHLAFSGARTHSNITAEMTAMVEALSFLGPHGLLDVSRLLGLALRPSALVLRCHRDSLTRWRLAFAQEVARVASASSSHLLF